MLSWIGDPPPLIFKSFNLRMKWIELLKLGDPTLIGPAKMDLQTTKHASYV